MLAEVVRAVDGEPVAGVGSTARSLFPRTMRHRRAVFEEDVDGVDADVCSRRPVADGTNTYDAVERVEPELQDLALTCRVELREGFLHEAVVSELVACCDDAADGIWVGERGLPRNEERRGDVVPLEQGEDSWQGIGTELAA